MNKFFVRILIHIILTRFLQKKVVVKYSTITQIFNYGSTRIDSNNRKVNVDGAKTKIEPFFHPSKVEANDYENDRVKYCEPLEKKMNVDQVKANIVQIFRRREIDINDYESDPVKYFLQLEKEEKEIRCSMISTIEQENFSLDLSLIKLYLDLEVVLYVAFGYSIDDMNVLCDEMHQDCFAQFFDRIKRNGPHAMKKFSSRLKQCCNSQNSCIFMFGYDVLKNYVRDICRLLENVSCVGNIEEYRELSENSREFISFILKNETA